MTDRKARAQEWLNIEGRDFLQELVLKNTVEQFIWSWGRQNEGERKRRLSLVLELAADLVRVRQTTWFATVWVEEAIEDIILGDRAALKIRIALLKFEDGSAELRERYSPLFAPTVEILQKAYDGWPVDQPTENEVTPKLGLQ